RLFNENAFAGPESLFGDGVMSRDGRGDHDGIDPRILKERAHFGGGRNGRITTAHDFKPRTGGIAKNFDRDVRYIREVSDKIRSPVPEAHNTESERSLFNPHGQVLA